MVSKLNKPNLDFWTKNPMTYVDFKKPLEKRLPKNKSDFTIMNKKIVDGNPDFLKIIRKISPKIKNKILLDLGCGFGSSTVILSKYTKKITAIDLTKPAIINTKKNLKYFGMKGVTTLQMDAEKLKFKKNSFDFVFSWGVIHHSHNPEKILKNIYKALKPGGSCFIMVYNHYSFRNILLSNYHLFIKGKIFKGHNYKSIATKFTDGYYQKHYKKNELYKILKNIGYKNIELSIGNYKGKILPFLKSHNSILGRYLSKKFGYFLYAKFQKNNVEMT